MDADSYRRPIHGKLRHCRFVPMAAGLCRLGNDPEWQLIARGERIDTPHVAPVLGHRLATARARVRA